MGKNLSAIFDDAKEMERRKQQPALDAVAARMTAAASHAVRPWSPRGP